MNCPTKEQVLEAAKKNNVQDVLKTLFPNYFIPVVKLKPGQIYEWGTESEDEVDSGLVVDSGLLVGSEFFGFVNFRSGQIYLTKIPKSATSYDLNQLVHSVAKADPERFEYLTESPIRGPKYLKSWCTR